jgi:hypothetical protein
VEYCEILNMSGNRHSKGGATPDFACWYSGRNVAGHQRQNYY